jgi:WD40 repeat protein
MSLLWRFLFITSACGLLGFCGWRDRVSPSVRALQKSESAANPQQLELVLRTGHRGGVHGVSFSPLVSWAALGFPDRPGKGELVATGGNDDNILLWDLSTGEQVRSLSLGEGSSVGAVAFSADGTQLAASGGITLVWDVASGTVLHMFKDQDAFGRSVVFSRDGRFLGVGTDKEAVVWDLKTKSVKRRLDAPRALVAFGDGPAFAAAGSMPIEEGKSIDLSISYYAKVWDIETGQLMQSHRGNTYYVKGVSFDKDNSLLVWGSGNCVGGIPCNSISVWKPGATQSQVVAGPPEFVTASAFCGDPDYLVGGTHDGKVMLWHVPDEKSRYESSGVPGAFLEGVGCSADRETIVSSEMKGRVLVWDTASPQPKRALEGLTNEAVSVQFRMHSAEMVQGNRGPSYTGAYTESGTIWNIDIEGTPRFLDTTLPVTGSADGRWLVFGRDHKTLILKSSRGQEFDTQIPSQGTEVAFSPSGNLVATSIDKKITIWNVDPWTRVRSLPEVHAFAVQGLAFSPDDGQLASASGDGTVVLWDVHSGEQVCRLGKAGDPTHTVWTAAFSSDGKKVAWAGNDRVITVSDAKKCTTLEELPGHTATVHEVTFSPQGDLLASAGWDGTVRVWSLNDPTKVSVLTGHNWLVSSVAFNSDGNLLVSGGEDGSARLWDITTRKELATLVTFRDRKNWLVTTPEGLFDSSAEAGNNVYWRPANNNELNPLEAYYTDFFHPGLLAELFEGSRPRPSVDISSVVRIPGLRLALGQKKAHLDFRDGELVVCFDSIPGVAVEAAPGDSDIPVEVNGFRVVPKDAKCRYQKILPTDAGNQNRLKSELESWASETFHTPWDGKSSITEKSTLRVLTVGVGGYPEVSGFAPLPYAETSAKAIRDLFVARRGAHLGYAKMIVDDGLYGPAATRKAIVEKLAELASSASEDDVVVLYISGHGVVTPGQEMFYFVPFDGKATDIRDTGLDTAMLAEALRSIPARRLVLIIDACESGGALEALSKIGEVKARVEERRAKLQGRRGDGQAEGVGVHLIAAALPLTYAVQLGPKQSALATALLNALGGERGRQTIVEVLQFVNNELPAASERALGFRQVPLTNSVGLDFLVVPSIHGRSDSGPTPQHEGSPE